MEAIRVAILTVSDRSSRGERPDVSGPALVQRGREQGWQVVETAIVPDEQPAIEQTLVALVRQRPASILSSPPAEPALLRAMLPPRLLWPSSSERRAWSGRSDAPGKPQSHPARHALARRSPVSATRTLIINLPGSPKAAVENLRHDPARAAPCGRAAPRKPVCRSRAQAKSQ